MCLLFIVGFFEHIKIFSSASGWLLISPVESVGDDAVMHKLPSPPKFNRDIELKNERKALTKWGRKKHSPSQKTQENYFLIYAQLYYQAAVTFGDFVVSVWWCCFEYCTSESILYVKIQQWWENPSVPVKFRDALELGFSYKEKKKRKWGRLCIIMPWKRGSGGHTNKNWSASSSQ